MYSLSSYSYNLNKNNNKISNPWTFNKVPNVRDERHKQKILSSFLPYNSLIINTQYTENGKE